MAFTLDIKKGNELRGRSGIASGEQFSHHPLSSFYASRVENSPPPTFAHCQSTSAPFASVVAPGEPADRSADLPSIAPALRQELSQERTSSTRKDLVDSQLPVQSSSLHLVGKAASPFPQDSAQASEGNPGDQPHSSSSPTPMVTLVLTEYLTHGQIWDIWEGHHPNFGPVVLKVVCLEDPPCIDSYYNEFIQTHEIMEFALKEQEILMGPLKDLQGITVPKYYGIYESEGVCPGADPLFLAMILEYVGEPLGPGYVRMNDEWSQKLFNAYRDIHLRGVHHGEIGTQHILYDKSNRIRLLSFRRSTIMDRTNRLDVHQLVGEALAVRTRLGPSIKGKIEVMKEVPDYWSQLENPEEIIAELLNVP